MNSEIEYITNITTSAILTSESRWSYTSAIPAADECVIRQILLCGAASGNFGIVTSTLAPQPIASIVDSGNFVVCPGTRIQLHGMSPIEFRISDLTGAPANLVGCFISINLDFIKYRR
jgi:orotidine-5'-phosphate decarboxylase